MDIITDNMLRKEIEREFDDLASLSPGSSEQKIAIENLATLYKLKIEETRNYLDLDDKTATRKLEKEKMEKEIKDRYFKLGVDVAGIVLPLIFYATWMRKGLKFEETGTFTSTTFKGLINRFRPTKN